LNQLCIVSPIYNESRTIPRLISELQLLAQVIQFRVVFVDDGSTDDSLEVLQRHLRDVRFENQVISKENGGKTSAIKTGLESALGTHILILDADLELLPSDIPKLWDVVTSGKSDFVFGYREFRAQSSFTWRYSRGNLFLSNYFGFLFNVVVSDIMCGFKLLPLDYMKRIQLKVRGFGLEVEIPFNMWRDGIRPFEVQVDYIPRSRMQGKTIGVRDALYVVLLLTAWRVKSFFILSSK
jgi:glycosyltransferase involved in cell wall biosynthesis